MYDPLSGFLRLRFYKVSVSKRDLELFPRNDNSDEILLGPVDEI